MTATSGSYYVPQAQSPAPGSYAAPPRPSGHGAETKMRWGRVLLVLVAVGTLLYLGAQAFGDSDTVSGGGGITSTVEGLDEADNGFATDDGAAGNLGRGHDPAAGQNSRSDTLGLDKADAQAQAAQRAAQRRQDAAKRRKKKAAAAGGGSAAAANAAPGTAAAGEDLPMTGAPTWLAAAIGFLLLAGGGLLQTRADRVATTAAGYRRGPFLRPLETVRCWHRQWYQWRLDIAIRD